MYEYVEETDAVDKAIRILGELAAGRKLRVDSEYIIGMAENGFVGFVMDEGVSTFSEIPFSQLVQIVKEQKYTLFC